MSGSAFGGDYYVDNSGCGDCTDYSPTYRDCGGSHADSSFVNEDTPAEIVSAIAALGGAGTHTIYVRAGLYNNASAYFNLTDTDDHDNITIVGDGASVTEVTNENIGTDTLNVVSGVTGLLISGITLTCNRAAALYAIDVEEDVVITNSYIKQGVNDTGHLAQFSGVVDISNCTIFSKYIAGKHSLWFADASTGNVYNNIFTAAFSVGAVWAGCPIFVDSNTGAGNITISNNIIVFPYLYGVRVNGATSIVNVTNNFIMGPIFTATGWLVYEQAGIVTATSNYFYSCYQDPGGGMERWMDPNVTDGGGNVQTNIDPRFLNLRGGVVIPTLDDSYTWRDGDSNSFIDVIEWEDVLISFGHKGTYIIDYNEWEESKTAYTSDLIAMEARGNVEVGSHGASHSAITIIDALDFSNSGGAATVAFDGDTITCDGPAADDFTIDVTDPANNTVIEIINNYDGTGDWTIARNTDICLTCVATDLVEEAFATMGATATPCSITVDKTGIGQGFYKVEIVDSKANINTLITNAGYSCDSWGSPFGRMDAGGQAAVEAAGFTSCRGYVQQTYGETQDFDLFDPFQMTSVSAYEFMPDTGEPESDFRLAARNFGFFLAIRGEVTNLISHSFEMAGTNWTAAEWTYFFEEIQILIDAGINIQVMRQDDFIASLSSWNDNDDGTYTKTYTDNDFHLQLSSPLINTGILIVGIHDQATPALDLDGLPIYLINTGPYGNNDNKLYFKTCVD